ncbi:MULTISPECIES: type II secretion system F family protein [unclassified Brevibacterium]|uniref:type II secretion system F family protein n=1 Tax=unclassified Brevibacterium TaxID=2614124 RepID=UPI0008A430D0|nr:MULTISPECIES: type II secretion system F family protein [unclassified Brevibacterium]OFL66300.1 hypothetical protein HMPREF2757_02715 [Brevibacterium sp. HMSC063G07]OFS24774.1 hypothetical protein HMPREF3162_10250 [Brevibacterium sp. HMSC07C04]
MILLAAVLAAMAAGLWMWDPAERRLRKLLAGDRTDVSGGRIRGRAKSFVRRFRRSENEDEEHAAAAIAVIDRAAELLRVGAAPSTVLAHLAKLPGPEDLRTALATAARSAELGTAAHQALSTQAEGLPTLSKDILLHMASVWFVAESAGAPAANLLERFAKTARMQTDSARERAIALAGPQSTVKVLTALPLMSLGLAVLIGADPVELLASVPGAVSCISGAVLLVVGRLWMRRMLKRAQ